MSVVSISYDRFQDGQRTGAILKGYKWYNREPSIFSMKIFNKNNSRIPRVGWRIISGRVLLPAPCSTALRLQKKIIRFVFEIRDIDPENDCHNRFEVDLRKYIITGHIIYISVPWHYYNRFVWRVDNYLSTRIL